MLYYQWLSRIAMTIGDNLVGAVSWSFYFANWLHIALLKRKLLLVWSNRGALACFCSACYLFHERDGGKLFEQWLLSPESKPPPFVTVCIEQTWAATASAATVACHCCTERWKGHCLSCCWRGNVKLVCFWFFS